MAGRGRQHQLGRIFDDVADVYDRVRPGYPPALFDDLIAITGLTGRSEVLEVGCGTGQATRSLAALGARITAVEQGPHLAEIARRHLAGHPNVQIEVSTFEQWNDGGRRFDLVLAASSWHWVEQPIGWQRARDLLRPGGWLALAGNVVVRRTDEREVYAETADLHELYAPGNPDWGHPPLEDEVRATSDGWGPGADPGALFGPTTVRWHPNVQQFDGAGFAELLRSNSIYQRLDREVREPLLAAIAERIRDRMGDRATRRYLGMLRAGQPA